MSEDTTEMTFERPAPKPCVANWEELGRQFVEERDAFVHSKLVNAVEDSRAPSWSEKKGYIRSPIRQVPKRKEYYSCFETAIACQGLLELYIERNQMPDFWDLADPVASDENYLATRALGRRMSYFYEWWLRTYTIYPVYLHRDLNSEFFYILDRAVVSFLNGESFPAIYASMNDGYEKDKLTAQKHLTYLEANKGE